MRGSKGKQVMSCLLSYRQQQIQKHSIYYYYHTVSSSPPLPNAVVSRHIIINRSHSINNVTVTMNNLQQQHTLTAVNGTSEAVAKNKRAVRLTVKKQLTKMDPTSRSLQDDAIQNIVLEAPWFKSCKRLCAYISCSALREVDTSNLLKTILHSPDGQSLLGKKLYVPRVEDKERNMRMFHISKIDDLVANSMNILEPAPVDAEGNEREDVMLANEPVDLLLLPGLAFDKSGRRLGRGGGYYDTFLMRYQELVKERNWKQPLLVALSYSEQIMEEGVIPVTATDVSVDALVTSSGVIPINPEAFNNSQ